MQINKRTIVLLLSAVFVIAVIVVGVWTFVGRGDQAKTPAGRNVEVRISITEEGFSPATVTVEQGMTVVWSNDTAKPHRVGANPYPDASSLPGLQSGDIAPGDTYAYTFDAAGTYGYTDYTEPTVGGSVQVK
jgi:plastocyanin